VRWSATDQFTMMPDSMMMMLVLMLLMLMGIWL
jgi:hypothetical protein